MRKLLDRAWTVLVALSALLMLAVFIDRWGWRVVAVMILAGFATHRPR